jgi:hypothetical protein
VKDAAAAKEFAEWAKSIAHDPRYAARLSEIVLKLADAIITPPKKRGRPFKPKLGDGMLSEATQKREVYKQTCGHAAISMYAHIVNARDIADGRTPEYPGYGTDISQSDAVKYLEKCKLFHHGRQRIKGRAKEHVASHYGLTEDALTKLIKDKLRQFN